MSIRVGGNVIGGNIGTDLLATKTDLNLSNSTAITNCITQIPQDIKLELNDGTLTLKAGSKVYVPNGTGVFNTVTIASDLSTSSGTGSYKYFVFYDYSANRIATRRIDLCSSGTSDPSTTNTAYYNTSTNIITQHNTDSTTWQSSFPLAIYSANGSVITSIDQVFNGFGYIGSTVFALPGVKGLIPNGRNADGTLKNIEFTVGRVLTRTRDLTGTNAPLVLNANDFANFAVADYNEELNLNISSTGVNTGRAIVGTWSATNGVIASFTPKTTFHALDYNDSSTISGWSMPSSRYIGLTLGASGATYTAPANGWFGIRAVATSTTNIGRLEFRNNTVSLDCYGIQVVSSTANTTMRAFVPVKKGDVVSLWYANVSSSIFGFIYAEGENV